jgi:hypothetical protein
MKGGLMLIALTVIDADRTSTRVGHEGLSKESAWFRFVS